MIAELQAFAQNEDVASFLQVFLGVACLVALIYAVRALMRPANPVRSAAMPMPRKSAPVRSRQVTMVPEAQQAVAEPTPVRRELRRPMMPAEIHWQRAIAPMQSSVLRGHRARELHQQAAVRLGAADYAFDRMLEELSSVIALPARQATGRSVNISAFAMSATTRPLAA